MRVLAQGSVDGAFDAGAILAAALDAVHLVEIGGLVVAKNLW